MSRGFNIQIARALIAVSLTRCTPNAPLTLSSPFRISNINEMCKPLGDLQLPLGVAWPVQSGPVRLTGLGCNCRNLFDRKLVLEGLDH